MPKYSDPVAKEAPRAEGAAPGGWFIRNGAGNRLLVNMNERVVYIPQGLEAVLPAEYSFGCPETLYLGSAWD